MSNKYPGVAQAPSENHVLDSSRYVLAKAEMQKLAKEFAASHDQYQKRVMGKFTSHPLIMQDESELSRAIQESENKIDQLQKEMDKYKFVAEEIKKMGFKIGDVAFHKEHGNVIVKGVALQAEGELFICGYAIICRKGEYVVEQNELVPISETTKILYGR
jgi:hypothetical protein